MEKQTAVQWFYDQITRTYWDYMTTERQNELFEQAKEMDKKSHEETWDAAHQTGRFEGKGIAEENYYTFEQYYNETYGGEK